MDSTLHMALMGWKLHHTYHIWYKNEIEGTIIEPTLDEMKQTCYSRLLKLKGLSFIKAGYNIK